MKGDDEEDDDFDVDDWEYSEGFDGEQALGFEEGATDSANLSALARRFNRRLRLTEKEVSSILSLLKPKEKVLFVTRADADLDGEFRNVTFALTGSRFFYFTNKRRFYSSSSDSFTSIWCDCMYTASVPLEKVTSVSFEDFGRAFGMHFLKIDTSGPKCYELQMPNYLFSKSSNGANNAVLEIFAAAVRNCKEDARRLGKKTAPDE